MRKRLPIKKAFRIYTSEFVDKFFKLIPKNEYGFRVFVYHSVTEELINNDWEENTIPKELFALQMKYLAENNYNVVGCREAVHHLIEKRKLPDRTVVITFDDGYRNIYKNALPVLEKFGFFATIFLTVNYIHEFSDDSTYLSPQEIVSIKQSGLFDFGCHGLTHKALVILNDRKLDKEISYAKSKLEQLIQNKIELFAYPFGHSKSYNPHIIEKLKSEGYIGSFTGIFGLNDINKNRFLLRRNRISWLDGIGQFRKHLNGSYDWCALFEPFRAKRY